MRNSIRQAALGALTAAGFAALAAAAAPGAEPIKIGFGIDLTGGLAANGRQVLAAAQMWEEDVNKKGGLLGRPVKLVYYDDQSNPSLVPGIYTKLLDVDKVDLLTADGTNMSAPTMPTVIEHEKLLLNTLSLAVNDPFKYPRYFQTFPFGPDGKDALAHGFFAAAMTMQPKPKTVALVGADAEFSKNSLEGARENARRLGLRIVYDRTYPPSTVDYAPILRAVKATNPDLVFVASYPADTAGMMRAVTEQGLEAKMFGGPMVGLQYGAIKQQLGEKLNGVVTYELYVNEPTMQFPGIQELIKRYQARAKELGTDPLGYYVPPLAYATYQVLEQAVRGAGTLDDDKLARYMHETTFKTIMGEIKFGANGEWAKPRILTVQFRNVKGNDLTQFERPGAEIILDPPEFKTGTPKYPFAEARR